MTNLILDIFYTTSCGFWSLHHTHVVLIPQGRARSDDGHFAFDDVEDLRQFIQACFSQEFADFSDVLIRILQQMRWCILRRIDAHRPEFQNMKMRFVDSDSFLFKEDRTRRIHFYCNK